MAKKKNLEDLELKYTEYPVCPECGHEHTDAWEWGNEDGEANCESCGAEFSYAVHISIDYSTSKI